MVRDERRINWPERFENGTQIVQRAATIAPREHALVARNTTVVRNIQRQQRVEVVPNRYYWHVDGGIRYCHYFDHGIHWYGFYHGPSFYWTRFYGDRWWWFDAGFGRWVYWWDGYWWWPGPTGVLYVYVDNNYYPYEEGGVTVKRPEVVQPPENVPSSNEGSTWNSPDGKRMVQVFGSNAEAFLYDKSGKEPVFLKYLGKGIDKVRFSGGTEGKPTQILIDFKDGSFALYTEDGDPVDAAVSPQSTPPLPTAPPPNAPPQVEPNPSPQQ
jgi:hypothetical protein